MLSDMILLLTMERRISRWLHLFRWHVQSYCQSAAKHQPLRLWPLLLHLRPPFASCPFSLRWMPWMRPTNVNHCIFRPSCHRRSTTVLGNLSHQILGKLADVEYNRFSKLKHLDRIPMMLPIRPKLVPNAENTNSNVNSEMKKCFHDITSVLIVDTYLTMATPWCIEFHLEKNTNVKLNVLFGKLDNWFRNLPSDFRLRRDRQMFRCPIRSMHPVSRALLIDSAQLYLPNFWSWISIDLQLFSFPYTANDLHQRDTSKLSNLNEWKITHTRKQNNKWIWYKFVRKMQSSGFYLWRIVIHRVRRLHRNLHEPISNRHAYLLRQLISRISTKIVDSDRNYIEKQNGNKERNVSTRIRNICE